MVKIIQLSSNTDVCWAPNASSMGFCWAPNASSPDIGLALKPKKTYAIRIYSPTKKLCY